MSFKLDCVDTKIGAEQLLRDEGFVEEFVCRICQVHVVGCGPQLTKCSHLFCGDCLQQWFAQHPANQTWAQRAKSGGRVPCPVSKTALHKEDDVYLVGEHGDGSSVTLWRMIQGLRIKCDGRRSDSGCCHWVGAIGAFGEHLESGSCGLYSSRCETEIPVAIQNGDSMLVPPCGFDKQLPSSPSTCSLCSCGPSSAEESSLECSGKESEAEACENACIEDSSAPVAEEASEELLTFLMPSAFDLRVKEDETEDDHILNSFSRGLSSGLVDVPLVGASLGSVTQQEQKPFPVVCPSAAPTGAPKKPKCKTRKGSSDEHVQTMINQDMSAAFAARQWQAHQWQAAQCQMAYTRQYQMAVYAAQMQHAIHYQKQLVGNMW